MPHLLIEYSCELAIDAEVEAMLDAVHRAVVASRLFTERNIKLRAQPLAHYRLGGAREPFIHAQLRLHAGRTPVQKRALSEGVLTALREQGWAARVITVEVVEMERASYAKYCSEA